MIGSFWNLCRACPSMPVDKLHSEYRSTYRWHEYTGNPKPEVVRKPPAANHFVQAIEPPLPRRKKCPELAYRTHEFIGGPDEPSGSDTTITRARSEERGTPSRRSKSEGPAGIVNGKGYENENVDGIGDSSKQAGESNGLFKKTISKLSTEYRLQFVWPHVRKAIKGPTDDNADYPRKSMSMNAIKSSQSNVMPTVHKKRTTKEKEATVSELEPLVNGTETNKGELRSIMGHKRAVSSERANQFLTKKENFGFSEDIPDGKAVMNGGMTYNEEWYKEVIELRKKAGEYKCRGWGIGIHPELYKKQKDLWDEVSKRSSLSALSLASSIHRPITKEEKDEENNKKSFQAKPCSKRVPGQIYPFDNKIIQDGRVLPARVQTIRHHLERTTGPDVEEGALIPSPTREKLMPAIPKDKDDTSHSSQRGSPKKREASRHGSPKKGSPQKGSPKKTIKGRSQSVGPSVTDTNESPKRQVRSVSTAPSATKGVKIATGTSTPSTTERRPRPSSLSTSNNSRSKSSSLRPSGKASSTSDNHHIVQFSQNEQTNQKSNKSSTASNMSHTFSRKISTSKNSSTTTTTNATSTSKQSSRPKSSIINGLKNTDKHNHKSEHNEDKILAENDGESQEKDTAVSISNCSPQLAAGEITEHIVKSPPEPTRVKSPEQILMRSPDPVNWTVPLDTGKTFTVTQNVKDGEFYSRPQSEVKASTPVERPPPAPQSAPPELTEQSKMEAWNVESKQTIIDDLLKGSEPYDPTITSEQKSDNNQRSSNIASDVFEIARNRFDRFWGGNKAENF